MHIYVKNMVSDRCKMIVKSELTKLGLDYSAVNLGEAEISGGLSKEQRDLLDVALRKSGLELMDDKKTSWLKKSKSLSLSWFIIPMNKSKSTFLIIWPKNSSTITPTLQTFFLK